MVSSKEFLEVLCLLAQLPDMEKIELLRYLCVQEDTEGSLQPHASCQGRAAE